MQDSQTGYKEWIKLRDYSNIEKIKDEEVLLESENNAVIAAKEKKIAELERDHVHEVENFGQKAISTR